MGDNFDEALESIRTECANAIEAAEEKLRQAEVNHALATTKYPIGSKITWKHGNSYRVGVVAGVQTKLNKNKNDISYSVRLIKNDGTDGITVNAYHSTIESTLKLV